MKPLIDLILSNDDSHMMLAAIISLLLVLFFVTLIHCYAKWFLACNSPSPSMVFVVPPVLRARHLLDPHNLLTLDATNENDLSRPGLEPSVISLIPQFVFIGDEEEGSGGLECVICLSLFEKEEKGRKLAMCHHAFHVECIDMWLHCHTTCPVCRAPAVDSLPNNDETNLGEQDSRQYFGATSNMGHGRRMSSEDRSRLEIVVEAPNVENGSNDACQRKVHSSSDTVE